MLKVVFFFSPTGNQPNLKLNGLDLGRERFSLFYFINSRNFCPQDSILSKIYGTRFLSQIKFPLRKINYLLFLLQGT
jgi:hypothetical protein